MINEELISESKFKMDPIAYGKQWIFMKMKTSYILKNF